MGLKVDPEKCTECGRCTTVCSLTKTGRIQPLSARIHIERRWPEVPAISVCRFEDCEGHPCIESCPFDAISSKGGIVLIDDEKCRGCTKCVEACPYGAIHMEKELKLAVKCDLCGGDPACVPECVTGALSYTEDV